MPVSSIKEMLEAGMHYGHRSRAWNPKMSPYIFGEHNQIHIIDLEKTLSMFNDAVNFLGGVAANRGKVLFVGTKFAAQDLIRDYATKCGMPYVDHRWLGGMLTNYKTVRQSIKRLRDLEEMQSKNEFDKMIKKEALQLSRELSKLQRSLGGIKDMGGLPEALFVVDVGRENIAIAEANKLRIPVVGIVDTNNNPDNVDYIIPGNDDSMQSIELYLSHIADAIMVGQESIKASTTTPKKKGKGGNSGGTKTKEASVEVKPKKVGKDDSSISSVVSSGE